MRVNYYLYQSLHHLISKLPLVPSALTSSRVSTRRTKNMSFLNHLLEAFTQSGHQLTGENDNGQHTENDTDSQKAQNQNGSLCNKKKKISGTVVLMKKNVLEYNDFHAGLVDRLFDFFGRGISLQLISVTHPDPENNLKGKLSRPAYLEDWLTNYTGWSAGDSAFSITFDWDEDIGLPGAFIIKNEHHSEFYLKTLTLEDVPNYGKVTFVCHSWVYPADHYQKPRIFFNTKAYLPHDTPELLKIYREEELEILRGDGREELKEWDRVYDYAYYNDLGDPEKSPRPLLGGHHEFPYPRRGRTGRPPAETDPKYESRLPLLKGLSIYVPRDERFGHLKMKDFLAYSLNAVAQGLVPELKAIFDKTPNEFDCFEDVLKIYEGGIELPRGPQLKQLKESTPYETLKGLIEDDGGDDDAPVFKLQLPHIIKEDRWAWRTDEEFAREMLAGVNPVIIRRLEEFPPVSNLDPEVYGNQNSTITEAHIKESLAGLTVDEAIKENRIYILDHHDALMPYLRRINTTATKTYATRTLLFLKDDGTLKLLAIELSFPHPDGDHYGCESQVHMPAHHGIEGSIWQLAKAYVAVNDSGYHQLVSHWLNTHAVIEPFIIATRRQLSVVHPIHKLLHPHFRDTMNINAYARATLINANGIFEFTVFPGKYALEMSCQIYRNWVFTEQALPKELMKRGMATPDSQSPLGYRLHIEDYPYAVDGLEIWSAIETWVKDYCSFYYKSDDMILEDTELQSWWKEVREKGHGDLKDESWWPEMKTIDELTEACTIIIWIASALHAAVNFGQYPYAGYLPNRPTVSRRFMPKPDTPEYEELKSKPDTVFLKTITSQFQTLIGISLIEVLSRHASDEVYLGQREHPEWTSDAEPLRAFERFAEKLRGIEKNIMDKNTNGKWKNRVGPVKMPYMLLYPTGDAGLTGKGIPNSVSI